MKTLTTDMVQVITTILGSKDEYELRRVALEFEDLAFLAQDLGEKSAYFHARRALDQQAAYVRCVSRGVKLGAEACLKKRDEHLERLGVTISQ